MTPERGSAGVTLGWTRDWGVTSSFQLLRNDFPLDLWEILLADMLKTRQWRCLIQVKDTGATCVFHSICTEGKP